MGDLGRGSGTIRGVAFDLDGTLYPNYRLYIRLLPFLFREFPLMNAFRRVRNALHRGALLPGGGGIDSFHAFQASLMAADLKQDPAQIQLLLEQQVYRGWENHFDSIRPFSHVEETLDALKKAGIKLAVLSDFPPEKKLALMGISRYFDAALCSESSGRLKPRREPLDALAAAMGLRHEEILYVGNSVNADIRGARNAGMQAALIRRFPLSTGMCRKSALGELVRGGYPVFIFRDYRQLKQYVLG